MSVGAPTPPRVPAELRALLATVLRGEAAPYDGGRSTRRLLTFLEAVAWYSAREPWLRAWTAAVLAGERDESRWPELVGQWIRDHVVYAREPRETIEPPAWTVRHRLADCDGMAVLVLAAVGSVGLDGWPHAEDSDGDGLADHVFAVVQTPRGPVAVDPTPTGRPVAYPVRLSR